MSTISKEHVWPLLFSGFYPNSTLYNLFGTEKDVRYKSYSSDTSTATTIMGSSFHSVGEIAESLVDKIRSFSQVMDAVGSLFQTYPTLKESSEVVLTGTQYKQHNKPKPDLKGPTSPSHTKPEPTFVILDKVVPLIS